MLSNLVSAKYSPTMIEDAYFIDRNGKLFGDILDFLRNAEKYKLPMNSDKLNALLIEAEYYAIVPLIQKIEEKLEHKRTLFTVRCPLYAGEAPFTHYNCSNTAPEKIKQLIEKSQAEKTHVSVSSIAKMAEDEGFHIVQNITTSADVQSAYVSLMFQGY